MHDNCFREQKKPYGADINNLRGSMKRNKGVFFFSSQLDNNANAVDKSNARS